MKKRVIAIISAVLCSSLLLTALFFVRSNDIFGHSVCAASRELYFDGNEITNLDELLEKLEDFPFLKKADLGSFPVYINQIEKLESARPEVEFIYTPCVYIYGMTVPTDAAFLDLSCAEPSGIEELIENLPYLTELEAVDFGKNTVTAEEKKLLEETFLKIKFSVTATYNIYGITVREDAETLDLSGAVIDSDIVSKLSPLTCLTEVNLSGNEPDRETMLLLAKTYPDIFFRWNTEVNGTTLSSNVEALDLTYTYVEDFEQLKESIPLLSRLTYIDAGYSSLTNDQLEELRELYPDIAIEWVVHMGRWSLRTDAVAFSVLIRDYTHTRLTTDDIQVLKYCTKLRALDIGHQAVTDISVIGDCLTELRVLILADNRISDLTPLSKLKHLHYLEFFVNRVSDISPLAECKELVDLNISYNHTLSDITPILNLPMLERLWLEHTPVSSDDVNLLRETYPEATIVSVGEGSVDKGWRSHKRYWAMIDMFNNNYMSEEFSKYDG